MVHNIAITKARINLGALAKRAYLKGEYFILEKDGIPIAGMMSADEMEDYLELRDPAVQESIRKSNLDVKAGRFVSADKLLAEGKAHWAKKERQKKKHA